jgi:hypothetical protein
VNSGLYVSERRPFELSICPNPTQDFIVIDLNLPQSALVESELIDITERKIETFVNPHKLAGEQKFTLDLRNNLTSQSVAFIRVKYGNQERVKKLMLL